MKQPNYQRLGQGSEESLYLQDGAPLTDTSITQRSTWNIWSSILGAILGILVGAITGVLLSNVAKANNDCTNTFSTWSPALSIYGDSDFHMERFNGALRDQNKFRGPPSQDIDNAWDEITYADGGLVRLSKEDLLRVNASKYAAEYRPEMGGGYIAGVEVLHQLHCVNMLRQATYMDYYLSKKTEWADQKTLRYHLDHCIDMLRQRLMCQPDVGMITYVWAKGWTQAFPDFNTMHKCRDYSKVVQWAHDNYVHGRRIADLERAPGALERDSRP